MYATWSLCLSIALLFMTLIWWKVQEDGEEHNLASFWVKNSCELSVQL